MILTDEERAELVGNVANIGDGLRIARAIESAVLRKLRERPADAWMRPSVLEGCGPVTTAFADDANGWRIAGLSVQELHIIPEEHE